jgi:hypothetical protein
VTAPLFEASSHEPKGTKKRCGTTWSFPWC